MTLFYTLSAIACFIFFCCAHYKDIRKGIDLQISDIIFTLFVTAVPFINTAGAIYAMYHLGWLNTTLIKGKKK
jgi:hypothetical protein